MKYAIETKVINTTEQIGSLVDRLVFRHAPPVPYSPTMYIDLECSDLCCEGSLSILTLLIETGIPARRVYLVDVHDFSVALQGVEDVQLMESATRRTTASEKFLTGLARCVDENVFMSLGGSDLASWKQAKEKGKQLFKAEHGGSDEVFNQRPISEDIYSLLRS